MAGQRWEGGSGQRVAGKPAAGAASSHEPAAVLRRNGSRILNGTLADDSRSMPSSPRASRPDEHLQRLLDTQRRIGREPAFVARCSPKVRIAHPTTCPAPWTWDRRISDHAFLYVRSGSGIF